MIITQTPLRVSFLGGGTDYPEYFQKFGGSTLATSIDKYTFVTVHRITKFTNYRFRVHYSKLEAVNTPEHIQHPSARECLRFLKIEDGVEIHYVNDLPARTGLGSSSAATVGLLHALHAFKGELVSQDQLAQEAVHIEQEMIKERVGSQDQYACALGGLRRFNFGIDNSISCQPLAISQDKILALQERLLLFYTGLQRSAHDVLDEQIAKTQSGANDKSLHELRNLVSQAIDQLSFGSNLSEFGEILHLGWLLKQKLSSKVSNNLISDSYKAAREAGAVGGKLLGAGGGGFLLLYIEPYNQDRVRSSLRHLQETRFRFESTGSRVIFYQPR